MRPIKLLSIALILAGIFSLGKATAQIKIGTNGNNIQPSSLLELESANQGFLLPRMANTIAIDALNPPNGMMIYRTTDPAGLYIRKNNQWEYITGFLNGDGIFNSVTVNGPVTALSFSGPLIGNASTANLAITATNSNNSAVTNDISNPGTTFPVFVNSTPGNQPLRTSSGNLSYIPATGVLTARGFTGLLTGDVIGNASSAVDAQNTVNIRITDDVIAPGTMFPTFVPANSGPLAPRVASTKLSFVPLTGELNATTFRGALIGNASSATSVTGNVAAINGGTGQAIYSTGDMLYASTSTALVKLPIGAPGTVLRVSAGNVPNWSTAGAGTVINVTGTPNRITVTDPTVSPVLDIATTYAGQPSISTLGTVTAGIWNATEVGVPFGGTGRTSLASGRVLVGNGIGTVNSVDGDVPNLVLTSNGPGLAPSFKSPGAGDMVLNVNQTITGIKTFGLAGNVGKLVLAGNTSGSTILNGPSAGLGGTVVLPSTGTLATIDGMETLSNKTLTSPTLTNPSIGAAVGTTLVLGGGSPLGTTNQTGTGRIVMDNTPTLITPNIGVATGTSLNLGGGTVTAATFSGTANDVNNVFNVAASTVQAGSALANSSTANNTAGTIVRRDGTGNFSAGTITANLTGTASNATLAANATTATIATNISITDDNTTPTDIYPTFVNATSGNTGQRINSTKLRYRPSTGTLTAIDGTMRTGQFVSTFLTGTPPFVVESATPVATLSIGGNAATATTLLANVDIYGSTFNGSASLAGTVAGQFGGTGVANTNRFITLAANLTTTGAGAIILNSAAGSDVTLPAIGTLYGTAPGSFNSANLFTSLSTKIGTGLSVFATDAVLIRPVASSLLGDIAYPASKGPVGTNVGLASIVSGTNLAGTVTIVMTGVGATSNKLIEVTYSENFPIGSYPILYPANPAAAELTGTGQVYAAGFTNRFEITSGSVTGLTNGTTYIWNYHVVGR